MEGLQELLQRTETIQKINALQERAADLLFTWPVLTGKDWVKREIRKYLLHQQVPPLDHYSWPNALLAAGLSQMQRSVRDNKSKETLVRYFDRWIRKGMPLYYVDNAANGTALLDLYENTGQKNIWRRLPGSQHFCGNIKRMNKGICFTVPGMRQISMQIL